MALSLDSFLQAHPWPEAMRSLGRPMDYLWRIEMSAAADDLWPYVVETSRLNRALGLGRMQFKEENGVLKGSARNALVHQEWVEVPWEWVAGRTLTSVREFTRGFVHVARGIYVLAPEGDGTAMYVYFGWIPRGLYGRLALKLGMPWLEKRYRWAMARVDAEIGTPVAEMKAFRSEAPALSDEVSARIAALRDGLLADGVSPEVLDPLVDHIERGDETELYRIQLPPLARRWRVDGDELLIACLKATRVGLLDLSWDVICPHCRGVRLQARDLGDVPEREACDVCDVAFTTSSREALEVTFHVHPSIREVPRVYYCSAEPSTKLHVQLQQRLAPDESRDVATHLKPGRYRLRVRGGERYQYLEVGGEAASEPVVWDPEAPEEVLAAGEAPTLRLVNRSDRPAGFVVEHTVWSDDALRPSRLLSMQQFRDLFSDQYLGAGIQISVGEQTILFTDMVGSTEFYSARGDPEAFMEVRRHFTELFDAVREHRGAVIKTIGDAVMAAFVDPVDGLLASEQIMRRFHPGRDDSAILLRASINTGPCIAVNLNSGIDYFGGTVNIAAKLQACAGAGQIALSPSTAAAPGVEKLLRERGIAVDRRRFEHRALAEPLDVCVWDVHASGSLSTGKTG